MTEIDIDATEAYAVRELIRVHRGERESKTFISEDEAALMSLFHKMGIVLHGRDKKENSR